MESTKLIIGLIVAIVVGILLIFCVYRSIAYDKEVSAGTKYM